MTARAVKAVQPFDFRADFGPQPEEQAIAEDPARVSFTGEEIAALIAQVRAETLAEVAQRQAETESERLARVTAGMSKALGDIVQVMSQIEAAQYDAATEARLRGLIEATAASLVHGQGDLFAVNGSAASPLPKEERG